MLPLEKVATIASNADMAFNGRSRRLNALINVFWDENTPENESKGAAKAKEITDLLKSFEADAYTSHAYGNYSTYFVFLSLFPSLPRPGDLHKEINADTNCQLTDFFVSLRSARR